jgi:hypothetical protein
MASIDTVNDLTARVQYVATAGQTVFDYTFPIFEAGDLVVNVAGSNTTNFTVSGEGNDTGGTVTLGTACTLGQIVTIYRDIEISRDTDVQQNGQWSSSSYNNEQDKIYLIMQQLRDAQLRSLQLPILDTTTVDWDTLTDVENRKGKYFYFNATTGALEMATSLTTTAITQSVVGGALYPRTAAEIAASVVPTNYAYPPGNVMRYGADPLGVSSSQTAFDAATLVASKTATQATPGIIEVPAGDYKVNWLIQDKDYLWVRTAGFRTRLLPIANTSPVLDVVSSVLGSVTGLRIESMLIDSQTSGVATGAGIGVRFKATAPGFIWICHTDHLYIRGFNTGFNIDCDINFGEVFANDFGQITTVDCTNRCVDIKGLYNKFSHLFMLHAGNYAMVDNSTRCRFDFVACDGPISISGIGARYGLLTIEAIYGPGAAAALSIQNAEHQFQGIVITEVDTAKCPVGVAFGTAASDQFVESLTVTGSSRPATSCTLASGSGGIIGRASGGGTPSTISNTIAANWRFLGTVSTVFTVNRYLDLKVLVDSNGNLIHKQARADQSYSLQSPTAGFSITIANNVSKLVLNPAGVLATGTIVMPAAPIDGQEVEVCSTQTITALTVNANTGQTIRAAPTTLASGKGFRYLYTAGATTWYPLSQP